MFNWKSIWDSTDENSFSLTTTKSFCIGNTVNNTRLISTKSCEVQYCAAVLHWVTWTSTFFIKDFPDNKGLTSSASRGHRKQLPNMIWFPACVLEDIPCHSTAVVWPSAIPVCGVTHFSRLFMLPWTSSQCHPGCMWPPGGPAADLSPDPRYLIRMGREELALSALRTGSLPAPLHASLLMSTLPSHTHFQIRYSFNSLSLPNRPSQRHLRLLKGTQLMPTFFFCPCFCFVMCDLNH